MLPVEQIVINKTKIGRLLTRHRLALSLPLSPQIPLIRLAGAVSVSNLLKNVKDV
jgi:hypothetical protein